MSSSTILSISEPYYLSFIAKIDTFYPKQKLIFHQISQVLDVVQYSDLYHILEARDQIEIISTKLTIIE